MKLPRKPNHDVSRYSREIAMQQADNFFYKILFSTGAVTFVLDYQNWKPVYRWWHPFTWIAILCVGVVSFFTGLFEAFQEVIENPPGAKLKKAPKYIKVYNDIVVGLSDKVQKKFADDGSNYYANLICDRRGDKTVQIGDRISEMKWSRPFETVEDIHITQQQDTRVIRVFTSNSSNGVAEAIVIDFNKIVVRKIK